MRIVLGVRARLSIAVVLAVIGPAMDLQAEPIGQDSPCVGDCSGDGRITVDELVLGVEIGLGRIPLADCPEFDSDKSKRVTIDELVRSVTDAVYGCGVTPPTRTPTFTPSPSRTPTITPPPTVTATSSATATTAPPNVSGSWVEDELEIVSSDCDSDLTDELQDEISNEPPCTYEISTNGDRVTAVDCDGVIATGDVDQSGTIHLTLPTQSETARGCTLFFDIRSTIPASVSPTTATHDVELSFQGDCDPWVACTIVVEGRWTRS